MASCNNMLHEVFDIQASLCVHHVLMVHKKLYQYFNRILIKFNKTSVRRKEYLGALCSEQGF